MVYVSSIYTIIITNHGLCIGHSEFCAKLADIDMVESEDVRAELVQLELRAIRYSRWALLELLEDFNQSSGLAEQQDHVHSDWRYAHYYTLLCPVHLVLANPV